MPPIDNEKKKRVKWPHHPQLRSKSQTDHHKKEAVDPRIEDKDSELLQIKMFPLNNGQFGAKKGEMAKENMDGNIMSVQKRYPPVGDKTQILPMSFNDHSMYNSFYRHIIPAQAPANDNSDVVEEQVDFATSKTSPLAINLNKQDP